MLSFARCAQVTPLTGGGRDITPPKLVEATPPPATRNFTGRSFELRFDEYVQVKNASSQVIVTPQTKEMPGIEARGKKVIVTFSEDLKPNTTYRLFFGNAIADMHEGNPLADFEYVFSTGNTIDSLATEGKVMNAFNLKPEKDVLVGLYDKDAEDSVIYKSKALYLAKADAEGHYRIGYLPASSFKAYAFTDRNKNLLYDGGEEKVDFKDSLVTAGKDTLVNFWLFREEPVKYFIRKSTSPYYGMAYIVYNKEVESDAIPFYASQRKNVYSAPVKNDTCLIYYYGLFDSLKVLVRHGDKDAVDTVNISIPSEAQFDRQRAGGRMPLEINMPLAEGAKLKFTDVPALTFNRWIDPSKTDTSLMMLTSKADSTVDRSVSLSETGITRMRMGSKLKQNSDYRLTLLKGAFTDMNGISNDSIAIVFSTTGAEAYGNLSLKLIFPKKENYIVQLMTPQEKVAAEQIVKLSLSSSAEQVLQFKLLQPGDYFVKVTEDSNGSKVWDTGDLMRKKHPETIYVNRQPIKLLADWDADIEWKVAD